ncbi:isochorismate synthase MenF [Picosynechococcus sp. NKBG15041c]|uniref:isochorismate synthase n=1 Tax=Picosynechococcus sp. NKBG15041c TaxID=1407650 RepID=UPI0004145DA6|nr:isochorismate synthase [Picosynechococcus sp. NKBG15041c]
MGKTLWRDRLEPDQSHGSALGEGTGASFSQRQVSTSPWQRWLTQKNVPQSGEIASEILQIGAIDSLVVLRAIEQIIPMPLNHFYWENRQQQRAILNFGSLQELVLQGENRFHQAQQFIDHWQEKIQGSMAAPVPYFACGFTFFSTQTAEAPFPAGLVTIPRLQLVRHHQDYFLVLNGDRQQRPLLHQLAQQFHHFLKTLPPVLTPSTGIRGTVCTASMGFTAAVQRALQLIDQGKLSKIVLAHALDVTANQAFDVVHALDNLRDRHPDCCIFSLRNQRGETFIGASPERLLAVQKGELITDALAGSAPRGNSPATDLQLAQSLLQSEKEQREHQAVTDFLVGQLKQLNLTPQAAPRTLLKLSNIQHLWTPISAALPAQIHPLEVVAQLHPTPAVAGVPRAIACAEIRQAEAFDRTLYAAPLGWLDSQGNSEFIVAIRSALIRGNHARLFGGAGIVAGSQPEREYAEVQLKLTSLLEALT